MLAQLRRIHLAGPGRPRPTGAGVLRTRATHHRKNRTSWVRTHAPVVVLQVRGILSVRTDCVGWLDAAGSSRNALK